MQYIPLYNRLSILSLLLILLGVSYVDGQDRGSPFVANYLPKDYGGHAQNWAIAQDSRGVMYFGNGNGLLEYDGSEWRITALPQQTTARSMDVGSDGIIYIGSSVGIGYTSIDNQGHTAFVSLNGLLPDSIAASLTDIWATTALGDEIFFRSYYCLIRYNVSTKAIKYWTFTPDRLIFSSFTLNGQYFFNSRKGLMVVKGDEYEPAPGAELILEHRLPVSSSIPYKEDTIILSGRNGNVYKYPLSPNREQENKTIFAELNEVFSKKRVYTNAVKVAQGYAFGSTGSGVLVFNQDFKFIAAIDEKHNGLQNSSVFTIFTDRDGATWIGGAKGIGRIDLAADISFWNSKSGFYGNGYSVLRSQETFYASSSEGVFYYTAEEGFQPIKGTEDSQSWHLMEFPNPEDPSDIKALLGSSGIQELTPPNSKTIYKGGIGAAFKLYIDKLDSSRIIIAGSENVDYIQFRNGKWLRGRPIPKTDDNNRSVSVDTETGDIWTSTFRNGVIRIIREKEAIPVEGRADSIIVKEVRRYTDKDGLLSNKNVIIFEVAGKRIFGTDKGICEYNPDTDRFEPSNLLGESYRDGSRDVFSMQEDREGNIWFSGLFTNSSPAGVARKRADGSYALDFRPFQKVPPMMALALYADPAGPVWQGGSEGLFKYQANEKIKSTSEDFHAIIRQVRIGQDSVVFGGNYFTELDGKRIAGIVQHDNAKHTIAAKFNTVAFRFAAPFFDNEDQTTFKFKLDGFDDAWSPWENVDKKEYTNLSGGDYTFRVKAKNLYGEESTEASYSFEVLPPFYKHPFAYLTYVILAFLTVWFAVRINARRLQLENDKLELIIEERTAEVRKQNTELEQQKEEIQAQADILKDANEHISKQKDVLSLKTVELSQQKEEILAQAENLRDLNEEISQVNSNLGEKQEKLEQAYDNIQTLSEIGQEITATLNLKQIIQTIYQNVNELMDASGFGVGVYNELNHSIDFNGYIEKGEPLPDHSDSLKNKNLVSVKVFEQKEAIISNNLEEDMAELFAGVEVTQGDVPLSMMYLPLIYRGESVGVITVQSFYRDAYSENDISILQNLASYASIAVANAISYGVIRSKNRSITDSIRYSRTMQSAFLPSAGQLEATLGDYFLIYRPKDIVSGDFYWVAKTNQYTFVAVVDCTGHGVPGSFMSIIGTTILNEIVNMKKVYNPATILEELNAEIIRSLHQNEQDNDDGMDLSLIRIENKETSLEVVFSGAKNDLYYIKEGSDSLVIVNGTRRHIGGFQKAGKSFKNEELVLSKGDTIYLCSDGMSDQNNDQGKKFGSRQVKAMLESVANLPMEEQKDKVTTIFEEHIQGMAQRDDITLLGFRL